MKKRAKGLSPVIATVLLVAMVVSIALIVFFWIKGMTEEAVTKFGDQNIQLVCGQVAFEASYDQDTLYITNPGSVPIFGMNVKVIGDGEHSTLDLRKDSANWPEAGLNQGGVFSSDPATDSDLVFSEGKDIILVPVLIGESAGGRKTYVCDENEYGYEITI